MSIEVSRERPTRVAHSQSPMPLRSLTVAQRRPQSHRANAARSIGGCCGPACVGPHPSCGQDIAHGDLVRHVRKLAALNHQVGVHLPQLRAQPLEVARDLLVLVRGGPAVLRSECPAKWKGRVRGVWWNSAGWLDGPVGRARRERQAHTCPTGGNGTGGARAGRRGSAARSTRPRPHPPRCPCPQRRGKRTPPPSPTARRAPGARPVRAPKWPIQLYL